MSPDEFEDYLVTLSDEEYTILMNARIAKLNPEQQLIAQAREVIRKEETVFKEEKGKEEI
jgi:hypothetical protein